MRGREEAARERGGVRERQRKRERDREGRETKREGLPAGSPEARQESARFSLVYEPGYNKSVPYDCPGQAENYTLRGLNH